MTEKFQTQKIAFVGTSSVGKTEILNELGTRYSARKDFAFVPEAARIFFSQHPEIPVEQRFSANVQGQVQDLHWGFEMEAHDTNATSIFCDRSVLDAVVYTRANGELEGSEELFTKVASWVATYTKIFLLDPKDVLYQKDDIRQESEETRQKNHSAFLEFFAEKGIEYELLSGTVEQRLQKVLNVVGQD